MDQQSQLVLYDECPCWDFEPCAPTPGGIKMERCTGCGTELPVDTIEV